MPPLLQSCSTCANEPLRPTDSRLSLKHFQDVARMNPGEAVKMDSEYKSFLAELGGAQPHTMDVAPQRG